MAFLQEVSFESLSIPVDYLDMLRQGLAWPILSPSRAVAF